MANVSGITPADSPVGLCHWLSQCPGYSRRTSGRDSRACWGGLRYLRRRPLPVLPAARGRLVADCAASTELPHERGKHVAHSCGACRRLAAVHRDFVCRDWLPTYSGWSVRIAALASI